MLKYKNSKLELAGMLLSFILLASLSFSASITYVQDGSPILTNGSSGSSASNLNSDDGVYYEISSASIPGSANQMLTNPNFLTDASGWTTSQSGTMVVSWVNTGQTGGSEQFSTVGRNKNGQGNIYQSFVSATQPASATINWCYRVTAYNVVRATRTITLYLLPPGGTSPGTQIDQVTLTGLVGWTCRNAAISSALLPSSGTYTFTARADLSSGNNAAAALTVQVDDFQLNFISSTIYKMNATHSSTATVSVPTNYTLMNVTAKMNLKSNSTSPTYALYWLYGGSYTNTDCSAATTIGASDVDLVCSDTSNPSSAISGSTVKLQLATSTAIVPFLASEDFIQYVIRFPNMTSSTISPSVTQSVYDNTTIQVNCSATADSDYAVTGVSYNLQWRNVSAGPTFFNIDTNSTNGLYLAPSTPTNPYTGITIPLGGSNTQTWDVVANLEGDYELRCFPSSTTGGNQLSAALPVAVTRKTYNFTVSPSSDSFSVQNDSYIDRNYTLTNTGNQPLSITCSDNATWVSNITACPSSFGAGSSVNVTFRFNATGRPESNESVLLSFVDSHVTKTATANVSITALKTYNFTVTPSSDSFSVQNDSYIDRNYTLTNTGNQPLSITCSDNATWVSNITACPSSFAVGTSINVTFRFNATGRPIGMEYVLLNFTDVHVLRNATAIINITEIDNVSPIINSVSDAPDPVSQNGTVTISANVTDNFGVSSVRVQINGTNYSMVSGAPNMWHYNYTISLPLGTYTYTVYANDTSNNNATPMSGNFTVSLVLYPTVTTDMPSYTMCSAVYYKVSVFDELDQPLNASITNSLISPSNDYIFLLNTFTGNGGTGVYLGMFYIRANYSTLGQWDFESLSGHVKGQTTFSIAS